MGKVQSHMETKVFEDTPPWDLETIVSSTDLDEETANACWRVWIRHPLVKSGQLTKEAFCALLDIQDGEETEQASRMFDLLDHDDDERLEFPDVMVFLFSLSSEEEEKDAELAAEAVLRRSFLLYDRDRSGKIFQNEMVEALDLLGMLELERDKGKVIVPQHVENLFSLMDFAHDGRIDQAEFLRATMHYRKLSKMLSITLLEKNRKIVQEKVKELIQQETA